MRSLLFNWYWSDTVPGGFCGLDATGGVSASLFANDNCWAFNGSRISEFDSGAIHDVGPELTPSDTRLTPDVAFLMLGMNDTTTDPDAAAAPGQMASLLAYMYATAPSLRILVTTITPSSDAAREVRIQSVNAALPAVWDTAEGAGQLLLRSDLHSVINPATDLADTIHPNNAGNALMAAYIQPFVRQLLGYNGTP